jgi:RNA polymerase sigma factor (sigma-70 family)
VEQANGGADAWLVARCREGDQPAWQALVERYAGLVNGILRGAFRLGATDAEDAFQEVFTRLYLKLDTIRDGRALAGWIARATRNVAVDTLRRNDREAPAEATVEDTEGEERMRAVLDAMVVREALMQLPEHQQEILDRFFVRDESYQAIGVALGIPPGTIASRISRALDALRGSVEGRSSGLATSSL